MGASYTNQLFSLKTMTPEKKIALFGKQGPGFGSNVFTFLYIIEKKFGRDFIDHNMEIVKDLLSGGIAKSNFTANNFRDTLNAIGKKYYGVVEDFDNIQVESIKFYDRVGKNILLQLPKMFDNKQFVSDLADKFNSLTGKGDIKFVKKDDSYVAMFDNRRVFTPNSDTGVKIYDILSGLVISSAFNENNRSLEDLCVSLYSESSADGNILGFRKHAKEGYADRVYIYAQKGVKLGLSYSVILENILGDINAGVSKMFSDFNTVKKMKADGKVFFLSRGDDEKVMYKFGGRNGEQAMANVRAEVGESGDDRFVANLDVLIGN
jgi:hypothetical protein